MKVNFLTPPLKKIIPFYMRYSHVGISVSELTCSGEPGLITNTLRSESQNTFIYESADGYCFDRYFKSKNALCAGDSDDPCGSIWNIPSPPTSK